MPIFTDKNRKRYEPFGGTQLKVFANFLSCITQDIKEYSDNNQDRYTVLQGFVDGIITNNAIEDLNSVDIELLMNPSENIRDINFLKIMKIEGELCPQDIRQGYGYIIRNADIINGLGQIVPAFTEDEIKQYDEWTEKSLIRASDNVLKYAKALNYLAVTLTVITVVAGFTLAVPFTLSIAITGLCASIASWCLDDHGKRMREREDNHPFAESRTIGLGLNPNHIGRDLNSNNLDNQIIMTEENDDKIKITDDDVMKKMTEDESNEIKIDNKQDYEKITEENNKNKTNEITIATKDNNDDVMKKMTEDESNEIKIDNKQDYEKITEDEDKPKNLPSTPKSPYSSQLNSSRDSNVKE